MAAVVSFVIKHGLTIKVHRRNQPYKSKLALCKLQIQFSSHLKHLYIINKMECSSYKGECGVHGRTHIEAFEISAGLGYSLMASDF